MNNLPGPEFEIICSVSQPPIYIVMPESMISVDCEDISTCGNFPWDFWSLAAALGLMEYLLHRYITSGCAGMPLQDIPFQEIWTYCNITVELSFSLSNTESMKMRCFHCENFLNKPEEELNPDLSRLEPGQMPGSQNVARTLACLWPDFSTRCSWGASRDLRCVVRSKSWKTSVGPTSNQVHILLQIFGHVKVPTCEGLRV